MFIQNHWVQTPKFTSIPSIKSIKKSIYLLVLPAVLTLTSCNYSSVSSGASKVESGDKSSQTTLNVTEELVNAMITQESGGNQSAVSPDGAVGLVQIMPATGKQFCSNLKWQDNPEDNKKCGGRIVKAYAWQLNIPLTTTITYEQCLIVLKAYNSGVGNAYQTAWNLDKWGKPTISNTGHAEIVCNAVNPAVFSNSKVINPVVVPKAPPAQPRQKQPTYSQPRVQTGKSLKTQCTDNGGTWNFGNKNCD